MSGNTIYMAEAGPVPHLPAGRQDRGVRPEFIVGDAGRLGRSAPRGRGIRPRSHALRALAGVLRAGQPRGFTGRARHRLARARSTATAPSPTLFEPLDRPTSLELIGTTAYVVTLTGQIWKIDGVGVPPVRHIELSTRGSWRVGRSRRCQARLGIVRRPELSPCAYNGFRSTFAPAGLPFPVVPPPAGRAGPFSRASVGRRVAVATGDATGLD